MKVTPGVCIMASICVIGDDVPVAVQSVKHNSCAQSTFVSGPPVNVLAFAGGAAARPSSARAVPTPRIQFRILCCPRLGDAAFLSFRK